MAHNLFPSFLSNSDFSSSAVQRSRDIISKSSACYLTQTKSIPSIDLETFFISTIFFVYPTEKVIHYRDRHALLVNCIGREKNHGESLHNIPGVYLILQKLRSLNTHAAVLQQLQSRWVLGIEIAQTVLNS